jgi:hypothetical protein
VLSLYLQWKILLLNVVEERTQERGETLGEKRGEKKQKFTVVAKMLYKGKPHEKILVIGRYLRRNSTRWSNRAKTERHPHPSSLSPHPPGEDGSPIDTVFCSLTSTGNPKTSSLASGSA